MKKLNFSVYYLQELNYRLAYIFIGTILTFITTYTYKQGLIYIFLPKGLSYFVSTGLTEIFFTYLQLCTILSMGFSLGIGFMQLYIFLRPGLYKYESEILLKLLIGTICFYLCLYTYFFPLLIQTLWKLFSVYSQNFTPINLTFEPRINDYLEHLKNLNKILSFSLPCLIGLNMIQKHTKKKLWIKYRGIIYIIAFSVAALITPPDIISQAVVGVPLIVFYEIQVAYLSMYKAYQKQLLIRQPIKSQKNPYGKEKESQSQGQETFPTQLHQLVITITR